MGVAELLRRREIAHRLSQDDGVVVRTGPEHSDQEPLRVDPVPLVIDADDWANLERGLAQRAEFLDVVLADIYGERRLVRRGLLPPELVVGNPAFFTRADGIPTRHRLFQTAVDLGRDEHGAWCVVADRAQLPVGAGYAMAIRRITARAQAALHRETNLRRLRGFFDVMRSGLVEMAPTTSDEPRVVLLTTAEPDETAFDEVFTATLLGFPVVQAEDLAQVDGRVWLRTTDDNKPVDVLVRRVPAGQADPLDLTGGSGDGLPGLVEAIRRGTLKVVNPVGAGVLENPALASFYPAIAKAAIGEDLTLPTAQTWWCGDSQGRRYVRDHLAELLVVPIAGRGMGGRVFANQLTAEQRAELWARIDAEPWAWCAQEILPMWSSAIVTKDGMAERTGVLRTFALADVNGVTVMPGGLARMAAEPDSHDYDLPRAIMKDVWVLAEGAAADLPVQLRPSRLTETDPAELDAAAQPGPTIPKHRPTLAPVPLSPGAAEDLYWFGRYAERAESTARLLVVADDLVEDHIGRPRTAGYQAMRIVLDAISAVTSVHRDRQESQRGPEADGAAGPVDPVAHLRGLIFDADVRGTVRYSARRAAHAAGQVRELLSNDTWLLLSRLDRILSGHEGEVELQSVLGSVIEVFLAVAGIGAEGLVRDASWAFFDAGRRVERAQETVRILARTIVTQRTPLVDTLVLEAVLRARESLISHRRRTADDRGTLGHLEVALDLLLTDPTNPRSVAYQVERLREDMTHVPSVTVDGAIVGPGKLLADADLEHLSSDRGALAVFLGEVEAGLRGVSATLDATSFRHRVKQQTIVEPR